MPAATECIVTPTCCPRVAAPRHVHRPAQGTHAPWLQVWQCKHLGRVPVSYLVVKGITRVPSPHYIAVPRWYPHRATHATSSRWWGCQRAARCEKVRPHRWPVMAGLQAAALRSPGSWEHSMTVSVQLLLASEGDTLAPKEYVSLQGVVNMSSSDGPGPRVAQHVLCRGVMLH